MSADTHEASEFYATARGGVAARLLTGLAGVTITEAVKDVYAALPLQTVPRRRLVLAEAA